MRYRITTAILVATFLITAAAPAMAQVSTESVREKPAKVKLETRKTAAVVEGGSSWVALNWRGAVSEATDFRVTAVASARGVEVSYPENTADYASLMDNDVLSPDEVDFTALHLVVPSGTKRFKLKVTATWSDGRKEVKKNFTVTVPTFKYEGEDVALVTSSGDITTAEPAWMDVEWTGLAPSVSDVRMVVGSPAGASVIYPDERAWSSLSLDDQLDQRETDVARFLLDASDLKPGEYEFKVLLSYTRNGSASETAGVVRVIVTG